MDNMNPQQSAWPKVSCTGFGGYCSAEQYFVRPERIGDVKAALLQPGITTVAPRGLERSYGDAVLNAPKALLSMARLERFLSFDQEMRVLRVYVGVRALKHHRYRHFE